MSLRSWKVILAPTFDNPRPPVHYIVARSAASAIRQAKEMCSYPYPGRRGVRHVKALEELAT